MHTIPNPARPVSSSQTSSQVGDIADDAWGKDIDQGLDSRYLIILANTVPLIEVFKHYGIRLNPYGNNITCPFKSHKGGRESTPSFYYYPETNSYWCWGCRNGSQIVDFVAEMDRTSKELAARKILKLFETEADEANIINRESSSERLEIMLDFSNAVREFYQSYPDEEAWAYVEKACKRYDDLYLKHTWSDITKKHTRAFSNSALRRVVAELKQYIEAYKP